MDIIFSSDRLEKECNSTGLLVRRYGPRMARVVRRRLDDLAAADCLGAMKHLPGRCHALTGDRLGQVSLDLEHPLRLILEPADDPAARTQDGGIDWMRVRRIRVLEIADTHR